MVTGTPLLQSLTNYFLGESLKNSIPAAEKVVNKKLEITTTTITKEDQERTENPMLFLACNAIRRMLAFLNKELKEALFSAQTR